MFLVRSAFWLTVAFLAFHPKDVDIGAAASSLSGQALAAGQQMVVSELLKNDCALHCPVLQAASPTLAPARTPSVDLAQASSPAQPAPFPRPRPAWMG